MIGFVMNMNEEYSGPVSTQTYKKAIHQSIRLFPGIRIDLAVRGTQNSIIPLLSGWIMGSNGTRPG